MVVVATRRLNKVMWREGGIIKTGLLVGVCRCSWKGWSVSTRRLVRLGTGRWGGGYGGGGTEGAGVLVIKLLSTVFELHSLVRIALFDLNKTERSLNYYPYAVIGLLVPLHPTDT